MVALKWPWPWGPLGLDPWVSLATGIISFFAEGLYGATSFGPAILWNIGWQICYMMKLGDGTLTTLAVDMTVMEVTSSLVQIILLWKNIDWMLACAICLPCGLFTAIGQVLMIRLDGPWLKRALGGILFMMALQRVYANWGARAPKSDRAPPTGLDLRRPRTISSVLFWFGFAGLMGGITSVGGPPMMLFVSIHANELNLTTWRACNAVLRFVLNISRGVVFAVHDRFHFDRNWPPYCSIVVGALLGLLIGNHFAGKFRDANSLHWFMVSLLCCSSVLMVASGSSMSVQRDASLCVGCLAGLCMLAALLGAGLLRCTRQRRGQLLQHDSGRTVQPVPAISPVVD